MELGKELAESMKSHELFSTKIFGQSFVLYDTVVVMWITMAVIIIGVLVLVRGLKEQPKGKQNFVEIVVELINMLAKNSIGHHWKCFAPYIGTILLFLVVSNIISIFDIFPLPFHIRLKPPTININVTACLAIMSMLLVIGASIRFKKFKGFIKSFFEPMPLLFPMKILEYLIKPLSLSLRLFGNILGAFIVMEILYHAAPFLVPAVFSIYFDLFDGLLQAYVFVFLTSLYVAEAVE